MPGRAGNVRWTVSGAVQTTSPDAGGRYVPGWEITYTIDTGHSGTVFVPGTTPNQDAIKAAINQQAQALHGVVNLSSGG
jgi:hypothetical protein